MSKRAERLVLAAGGLIAGAACCARAGTVVVISNGASPTIVINGHIVSGGQDIVVAKGPIRSEERSVPAFTSLELDAPVEATFSPGPNARVIVTAPSDILALMATEVEDGTLVIALKGSVEVSSPIRVSVNGPGLAAISLAGAGRVKATGLSGPDLSISLSGSGDVAANGSVGRIGIRLSGSGNVDVAAIQAADVSGAITGSGSISAFASRSVEAELTGSGAFIVFGNPPQRATHVTGSGEVLFR
jgi:Putative auto-transporter adhesin, head GIN domain